jgi:hypothetical protein
MKRKSYYITYIVVILTGIFCLGAGLTIINSTTAVTMVADHPQMSRDSFTDNQVNNLPESVKNAVLEAVSQRLELPVSQLKIVEAVPQTWNDGCLNLAAADEFCTQALVPGWRVTVQAPDQILVYHTNSTGSAVRLNAEASEITPGT